MFYNLIIMQFVQTVHIYNSYLMVMSVVSTLSKVVVHGDGIVSNIRSVMVASGGAVARVLAVANTSALVTPPPI